jgi:hypothetical protein
MGHKITKSDNLISDAYFLRSTVANSSSSNSAASTSSSNSSSAASPKSKSKSNHESAISNDSGCYSATENLLERFSSQSGSSALCIYDFVNAYPKELSKSSSSSPIFESDTSIKSSNSRNNNKSLIDTNTSSSNNNNNNNNNNKIKSNIKKCSLNEKLNEQFNEKSKTLKELKKIKKLQSRNVKCNDIDEINKKKSSLLPIVSLDKIENESYNIFDLLEKIKYKSNSCEDSLDFLLSKTKMSSSNSTNFDNLNQNGNLNDFESYSKNTLLLCNQLNQLLNFTTNVDQICAMSKKEAQNSNFFKEKFLTSNNDETKKKPKSLNRALFNITDAKQQINKSTSPPGSQITLQASLFVTDSTPNKPPKPSIVLNRSNTFHSNEIRNSNAPRSSLLTKQNKEQNSLISKKEYAQQEAETKTAKEESLGSKEIEEKKFKLTKYFIKNSRNLFTWNRKLSDDCTLSEQKFSKNLSYLGKKCSNNSNAKSTTINKEEQIINLIAAKLLSENIDIAQEPYTDEVSKFLSYKLTH